MRHHQLGFKAILLAGAASSGLFGLPAFAQSNGQQVAQAGGGDKIEEVVVTARKREENVQNVPIAVSVQSGEFLQQHQISDVYSLENVTPSLQVASYLTQDGQPSFAIRGIGTAVFGPQIEASVGVVQDDVPISRIELGDVQFFDLDRVEVLRGPQGMLFGKNAAAGLINVVSASPELGQTELLSHLEYGNMSTPNGGNEGRADVAFNTPITDDSALRIDGFLTRDPGFVKNVNIPQDFSSLQAGARAKFLWEPTSSLRVLLTADYVHENGLGDGAGTYRSTSQTACLPPPNSAICFPGQVTTINKLVGITASPDNVYQASSFTNSAHYTVYGVALKVEYDLGGGYTLTNVVAQRGNSEHVFQDGGYMPLYDFDDGFDSFHYMQQTEELRITSPSDGRFTYQAGVFYLHLHAGLNSGGSTDLTFGKPTSPPYPPGTTAFSAETLIFDMPDQDSLAGYFESQFKLLDSLSLTSGVRFTHDSMSYFSEWINPPGLLDPYPFCSYNFATGGLCFINRNKDSHSDISYRFSLDYDIAPDVMGYVSYSKGYKGPTFDQLSANIVGPEIPKDIEVGVKSTILNDRLRLNVDLFHEVFDGYQAQITGLVGGLPVAHTTNAGQLLSRGVEVEFTALPVDGLTLTGGVTYNATEFSGLPPIECYASQPVGFGPNQCNPSGPNAGDYSANGDPLDQAPLWTEAITARYEQPVWSGWDGFIQGDAHIQSGFNFTISTNPNTRLDGTSVFGLATGAESEDGHVVLTLFVRNLFDKRIPSVINTTIANGFTADVYGTGTGDWGQQFSENAFRTVGLSLDYRM